MNSATRPTHATHFASLAVFGPARRWVLWCLLMALPVYGLSGTVAGLLGHQHFHAAPAAGATATVANAGATDPMADWQYFRRIGAGPHPATPAIPAPDRVAHADAEAEHSHDGLSRHHHAADDDSVITIDGAGHGDGLGDDGGAPGSGGAGQMFALARMSGPPAAESGPGVWPRPAAASPRHRDPDRLDRPPKA